MIGRARQRTAVLAGAARPNSCCRVVLVPPTEKGSDTHGRRTALG